jgi:SAM-dependent methyltransferase
MTEYLDEQPAVAEVHTLDVDGPFVEITRTKVAELRLRKVHQVLQLSDEETTRLPAASGTLDLVLAIGVTEHLPFRGYVDEHYRVLAPGGHIAILDTPNRTLPLEPRSVWLPGVQLEAGYSWHFFRDAARSRTRRGLLPAFATGTATLRLAGGSPSLALPYFNLIFRKAPDGQ